MVVTKVGQGKVVGLEILARKMVVQYEDRRTILTEERDILTVISKGKQKPGGDDPHDLPPAEEN